MSYWSSLSSFGASLNDGLKTGFNYVLSPQKTIAEREQVLSGEFIAFQQELAAVKLVLDNLGCDSPFEQEGMFNQFVESVEGPDYFYREYSALPFSTINGPEQKVPVPIASSSDEEEGFSELIRQEKVDEAGFKRAFMKCRTAFHRYLEEPRPHDFAEGIFVEMKSKIEEIYVEKESIPGVVIDGFRGWLKSTGSSSIDISSHRVWLEEIEKMRKEWDAFIPAFYEKITKKILVIGLGIAEEVKIDINGVHYRLKCFANFDYREQKKGVNFDLQLKDSGTNRQFNASFFLRRNSHGKSIEILSVENEAEMREARDRIDMLIYQLIAEILGREKDEDYWVVRMKKPLMDTSLRSSSSASVSRLSTRRVSMASDGCRREDLSGYLYEPIPLEDQERLGCDYSLKYEAAKEFLKDKQQLLIYIHRITLI